jgi:hypothetical protein
LDESLRALDLAQQQHPDDARLTAACNRGASRYIAGEVYRSILHNPERTRALADRMLSYRKSPLTLSIWAAAQTATRLPFLRGWVQRAGGFVSAFFK